MKWLLIAAVLCSQIAQAGPRTIGNGGGGVARDGVYMTFGSAGVYVDPEPMGMETVPSLDLLLRTIREAGIPESEMNSLFRAAAPFGAREYFNVIKDKFDEVTYKRLREEYAALSKQPAESIVIFAVTDPSTRKTFLLPEFFGLKASEQAAILFHEAYWVIKPGATYQEVVSAEIAFQKFLEQKAAGIYEPKLADKLGVLFASPSLGLNMHLKRDLQSGVLAELGADSRGIPLTALIADPLCDNHESYWRGWHRGAVTGSSYTHLYDLSLRYPQSHFLRGLMNFLAADDRGVSGGIMAGLSAAEIKWIEARSPDCRESLDKLGLRTDRVFHDEEYGTRILYLDRAQPK